MQCIELNAQVICPWFQVTDVVGLRGDGARSLVEAMKKAPHCALSGSPIRRGDRVGFLLRRSVLRMVNSAEARNSRVRKKLLTRQQILEHLGVLSANGGTQHYQEDGRPRNGHAVRRSPGTKRRSRHRLARQSH